MTTQTHGPAATPGIRDDARWQAATRRYWRANVAVMSGLLLVWAFVGLGCGILWADWLNGMGAIGGVPLGFWFAQQGSIATFVVLILVYAIVMNRLDAKFHERAGGVAGLSRELPPAEPTEGGDA